MNFASRSSCALDFGRAADPADFDTAARLLRALPVEELERLARRYFSPSALRRRRLDERDDLIRGIAAAELRGDAASGRALADSIATELGRYAASAGAANATGRRSPIPAGP